MSEMTRSGDETRAQPAEPGKKDTDLSEFLLRACHDLRTPLRAIRVNAELLLKSSPELPPPGLEDRLAFVVQGARRIELLADGLSAYSIALRIRESSFRAAQMDALLRAALARTSAELKENGAQVTYDALPAVIGDPDRLSQVFENLLLNAVRHRGPAAPLIHVTAVEQPGDCLFTVRDNGPGIEAAYLERIFSPFERLNTANSLAPGLGLAISRAIVEKHGGRMWAESEVGTGSSFLFTIPGMLR